MRFGSIVALAAGASVAAGAVAATASQFIPIDGAVGDVAPWDPSSPSPATLPGPMAPMVPIADFAQNGVTDSAMAASTFFDSALSSRTLDNAVTGDTDAVKATGAPVPHPSLWTWMLAKFDGVGAALRRIAASA